MTLLPALLAFVQKEPQPGPIQSIVDFLDTPAPYSPFTEYLAVLFLFWLLARRGRRRTRFDAKAQKVLDENLAEREIDRKTKVTT